jgi:hypothetical protein
MLWPGFGRSRGDSAGFRANEKGTGPFGPRPDRPGRVFAVSARGTLVAGCLLIAVSGCQVHQTTDGFTVRSPWFRHCEASPTITRDSYIIDRRDLAQATEARPERTVSFVATAKSDQFREDGDEPWPEVGQAAPTGSAKQPAGKPELLAWHTRLKDRIAARLHGRNPGQPAGQGKPPAQDKSVAQDKTSIQDRSPGQSTLIVRDRASGQGTLFSRDGRSSD